jgi:hypothetical protein
MEKGVGDMEVLMAGLSAGQTRPLDGVEAETTGGGEEGVRWVKVATAVGTPNAVIIAGRLENRKIPTRVTQEAAGLHAIAVNVGILGTAYVWVPDEFQEQAQAILAKDWDEEE